MHGRQGVWHVRARVARRYPHGAFGCWRTGSEGCPRARWTGERRVWAMGGGGGGAPGRQPRLVWAMELRPNASWRVQARVMRTMWRGKGAFGLQWRIRGIVAARKVSGLPRNGADHLRGTEAQASTHVDDWRVYCAIFGFTTVRAPFLQIPVLVVSFSPKTQLDKPL